jgi:hypothetical protein
VKIRTDFVANSSSTSFLIITSGDLKKEDFFRLVGVIEESRLGAVFEALFACLVASMVPADQYHDPYYAHVEGLEDLVKEKFSQEAARRVVEAQHQGKQIFIGDLSSDTESVESFFCCESFELEDDNIYFNALECTW